MMDEDATKAEQALAELLQMQCAICEAPKPTEQEWAVLNALAAGTVRVVPVEPTEDMQAEAVMSGMRAGRNGAPPGEQAKAIWSAMLAAAPAAPKEG